jgi:RNA polymerase sigma-70 factor (ECF subfamily)
MTDTAPSPLFLTTRWSVVLAARGAASPEAAGALETLCRSYWYPLYAYARRAGLAPHDAQDLTQEFFARLLEKDWLHGAAPERGRFRTFLLVALKRLLAKEWHRARTQKRGGGISPAPFELAEAEQRYAGEPPLSPDEIFDRRWAMTLLEQTLARLHAEFAAVGKAHDFELLREWLTAARGEIPYAELAARLGSSEGAARVAVHRLRKRFRELFREAIAQTVSETAGVEEEMRHVAAVLSRSV